MGVVGIGRGARLAARRDGFGQQITVCVVGKGGYTATWFGD